jgi:TrpR-related protein YerC/YecD
MLVKPEKQAVHLIPQGIYGMILSQGKARKKREGLEMFEPKVRSGQTDRLMKAMLSLDSEETAYRFFEDLCTIPEIKSISQRLEVAYLLRKGETYQKIEEVTGASSATISRVNRALSYGADGYNRVLNAMDEIEDPK